MSKIDAMAENAIPVRKCNTAIDPTETFDPDNPQIKKDVIQMIVQYLESEGYTASVAIIQDETNVKGREQQNRSTQLRRTRQSILDGEWEQVASQMQKHLKAKHNYEGYLYAIHKQEYLELIDRQESQKAFVYLTTQLKPLEKLSRASNADEFEDLCYLLTCKSVRDAESFKGWQGVLKERQRLADDFQAAYEVGAGIIQEHEVPRGRLVTLLQRAFAHQMEFGRYHPKVTPKVETVLRDYQCLVLPNDTHTAFIGHSANVKCVHFVGEEGHYIASGSSDNSICVWRTDPKSVRLSSDGEAYVGDGDSGGGGAAGHDAAAANGVHGGCRQAGSRDRGAPEVGTSHSTTRVPSCRLTGHEGRIWDLSSSRCGRHLVSVAGDGVMKVWDLRSRGESMSERSDYAGGEGGGKCMGSVKAHDGDAYTVTHHPHSSIGNHQQVVSGGFDHTVRLLDLHAMREVSVR
jgi:hypothetical protein